MTRILGLAVIAALATGCATTSSVKEEMAPLSSKVTALEPQDAAMNAKLADLGKKSDAPDRRHPGPPQGDRELQRGGAEGRRGRRGGCRPRRDGRGEGGQGLRAAADTRA